MTPKQEAFVREYLIDLNATQAAIRAGYSAKTARTGYYVYLLVDARDGAIFYIGKGKRNRASAHVSAVRHGRESNGAKAARITDVLGSGSDVLEFILEGGLSETDALALERELIGALAECGLTNIAGGNISPQRALMDRIEHLASTVRPYAEWIALPDTVWTRAAERIWGSKRQFYDWYAGSIEKLSKYQEARL